MVGAMSMNASPSARTPGPSASIAWLAPRKTVVSAPCHAGPRSAVLTDSRPSARLVRVGPPALLAAMWNAPSTPDAPTMTRPSSCTLKIAVSIHSNIWPDSVFLLTQLSNDSAISLNDLARPGMYDMPTVPSSMMALVNGLIPSEAIVIASDRYPKLSSRRSRFPWEARVSERLAKNVPSAVAVDPRPSSSIGRAFSARFRIGASALAQKLSLMRFCRWSYFGTRSSSTLLKSHSAATMIPMPIREPVRIPGSARRPGMMDSTDPPSVRNAPPAPIRSALSDPTKGRTTPKTPANRSRFFVTRRTCLLMSLNARPPDSAASAVATRV